jgi:GNAT superfamily N-acetyltransferase
VAVTIRVRPAAPADLLAYVEIRNAVTPEWSTSLEELDWAARTYPGGGRFVAEEDGRPIGAANAGRIYMQPPDYPYWWAEITVLPDARRRGAGSALLAAVSRVARQAGKVGLEIPVSEARPDGVDFVRQRGFTEHERSKTVRLELSAATAPPVQPPAGVRLVTLAERPDLVPGVHAVALETFDDIPGGDPMSVGELAEFRARDVERPGIRPEAFFVALAEDSGKVVGYASLLVEPGRPTVAYHDMTAVSRAWRGRGLATALKRATIRWAARAGLEALETGNDEANVPMRAVNARLGYRPLPDLVFFRGPLAGETPTET